MPKVNYERNTQGMAAFTKSAAMGDAMLGVAQEGVAFARSIAPTKTGAYKASIKAQQVTVPVGKANDKRAGAMISTDSPYGGVVEHNAKVLNRTADHLRNKKG